MEILWKYFSKSLSFSSDLIIFSPQKSQKHSKKAHEKHDHFHLIYLINSTQQIKNSKLGKVTDSVKKTKNYLINGTFHKIHHKKLSIRLCLNRQDKHIFQTEFFFPGRKFSFHFIWFCLIVGNSRFFSFYINIFLLILFCFAVKWNFTITSVCKIKSSFICSIENSNVRDRVPCASIKISKN
jgi:hypothetical protein